MQYLVRYRTPDGIDRYEEIATVEGAIALVERLRNEQGVSDVRVYRQVPIEIRTYYKVVVHDESQQEPIVEAPPGAMPLGARPVARPSGEPAVEEAAEPDEPVAGKRALFTRS